MNRNAVIRWVIKPLVFVTCLLPFVFLVWRAVQNDLGANPVETLTRDTGEWALRFLLVTLTITPLRMLTGQSVVVRFRRMLGLYAFFYALMHFMIYIWLDRELALDTIVKDVIKRPYITVGFTAFVLLWPLALTSTKGMIRRLGKRWQKLHRLVYIIAVLGVLHFLWLVKADVLEPIIYGSILIALLTVRAVKQRRAVAA
jgi:sulfoxide reductase heme-binding subunit YedZ